MRAASVGVCHHGRLVSHRIDRKGSAGRLEVPIRPRLRSIELLPRSLMSFALQVVCSRCGKRFELSQWLNLCPCGSPLLVRYDLERAKTAFDRASFARRSASLWRYRELLPLQDDGNLISLGEGYTPLLAANRLSGGARLAKALDQGRRANPTGSFKARVAIDGYFRAKTTRRQKAGHPSAGNAGGAFAAYAARAGIEVLRLHAGRHADGESKRSRAVRREVTLVNGLINDCGRIVAREEKRRLVRSLDVQGAVPGRRQKDDGLGDRRAVRLAISGRDYLSHWRRHRPDRHVESLRRAGGNGLDRQARPRMVSVQARVARPRKGVFGRPDHCGAMEKRATVASGFRVPGAVGDFLILRRSARAAARQ